MITMQKQDSKREGRGKGREKREKGEEQREQKERERRKGETGEKVQARECECIEH